MISHKIMLQYLHFKIMHKERQTDRQKERKKLLFTGHFQGLKLIISVHLCVSGNKPLPAHFHLCFFIFKVHFKIFFGHLHIYALLFQPNHYTLCITMFWTVAHLSTPFWCFAVLESSSRPPARNLLCARQTETASAWREEHVVLSCNK